MMVVLTLMHRSGFGLSFISLSVVLVLLLLLLLLLLLSYIMGGIPIGKPT
uniref:NADH dehydrogenase subunit 6 n=1 Tax=Schistosoma curassoni TaxID=6186 RepID=A0A183KF76_9TREM